MSSSARRVLFVSHACYLDDANGAAVASRSLIGLLQDGGFSTEVLSGIMLDRDREGELAEWLAGRHCRPEPPIEAWGVDGEGRRVAVPPHLRVTHRGIAITLHRGPTSKPHETDDIERIEFLTLLDLTLARFRPDVVVGYGGDRLANEVRALARAREIVTVVPLHNFHYLHPLPFADADEILVPSRFAADYYREALGIRCQVLANPADPERSRAESSDPRFATFVNPSVEKGVYAFARIADELGRRRPDIPILVVESRGTEDTVAACGLELRDHGTVHFMAHTADPREFWGVTKVCLMPSLWWESQGLVAVEAMVNGIPVIGSDRGGIPETLGDAGIVLPLPERITPATRMLPTAEEVAPWVEAVIRLWDDAEFYQDHRRRALAEARRWDPEVLEPRYVEFFRDLKPGPRPRPEIPPGRAKAVVLVPHLNGIDWECEEQLRKLEEAGVRVVRSGGCSAVDVARNRLASAALHEGAESILFIDSDLGFDPADALRLLARPEPVVGGVYAKKGRRELTSVFAEGVEEVVFGAHAFGLYPMKYAATGFLRIKATVLRRMIEELGLPLCNTDWGRGEWPFFQPTVVETEKGGHHYLGEDWAFSHRLGRIGVTPLADTSIRLWHYGRHPFGWEEAGIDPQRHPSFTYRLGGRRG
jgi:glycosyltransferase involved in cell wall biosynthesis